MIRYITSFGEKPRKRPARSNGARTSNVPRAEPRGVVTVIARSPGWAFGAIETSTKTYVPRSLIFGAPITLTPVPATCTLAPCRFLPRIIRRTGFIELLVHQLGGSTFRISGAWAETLKASHR